MDGKRYLPAHFRGKVLHKKSVLSASWTAIFRCTIISLIGFRGITLLLCVCLLHGQIQLLNYMLESVALSGWYLSPRNLFPSEGS